MEKTFIGPRLRQLRRDLGETQAEMARRLGISSTYVNLLEANQRSLSVKVLLALSETYNIDWRELVSDDGAARLPDLRAAVRDPLFAEEPPDLTELRAAIDHAPTLVERFLTLHANHRRLSDRLSGLGAELFTRPDQPGDLLAISPETAIHDFFRDRQNHFKELEARAQTLREKIGGAADDLYASLKRHLRVEYGLQATVVPLEEMPESLRLFDRKRQRVLLSDALDHPNRVFQLAHVVGLLGCSDEVERLATESGIRAGEGRARLAVELTNYFAAAFLMPYSAFRARAESTRYDIDRLAAAFGVSFEQVCHRLTTLSRPGQRGVAFFFLRVDRAGNVTKRFNATPFDLAEKGGSCPVWDIHGAFRAPGVLHPKWVELAEGGRFLTVSRTTERPVFNQHTQDRRLVVVLGCAAEEVDRVVYGDAFGTAERDTPLPIGIACHRCPRQACDQRAHAPLHVRLSVDADKRGRTRYES
ncbi:MAG: short-chain fatty acyl-CoA regulator family protein [Pseudomonadota bacterium]